mgnify:CR=1 FL=1
MTETAKTEKPSTLGEYLKTLRTGAKLSLRDVEDLTDREVSNPYLSQLENDKISKPSPNILHTLSNVYRASYATLMEKAGYISQGLNSDNEKHGRAATYAIENLTADEEKELIQYLSWYRSRRRKK